jgi:hypothetical protein
MNILQHTVTQGDKVSYYLTRSVSDPSTPTVQIRKVGRVQVVRDDQVKILHAGGYTDWVRAADLCIIETAAL